MAYEESECDRCGSTIVESVHRQPRLLNLRRESEDENDNPVYEQLTRVLCRGCEDELILWVDEGDVDRTEKADLPHVDKVSKTLDEVGEELTEIADVLEANNNGGESEAGAD